MRTKQQKAIAHTEAAVAWQDMYRRRKAPRRLAGTYNRSVMELADGRFYHATKGYRGRAKAEGR